MNCTLLYTKTKEFSKLGKVEFQKQVEQVCLNDQALICLIHFYKRCVSMAGSKISILFRTNESLLN